MTIWEIVVGILISLPVVVLMGMVVAHVINGWIAAKPRPAPAPMEWKAVEISHEEYLRLHGSGTSTTATISLDGVLRVTRVALTLRSGRQIDICTRRLFTLDRNGNHFSLNPSYKIEQVGSAEVLRFDPIRAPDAEALCIRVPFTEVSTIQEDCAYLDEATYEPVKPPPSRYLAHVPLSDPRPAYQAPATPSYERHQ